MNEDEFAALRQHMVMEVATNTVMLGMRLGKFGLDPRVMEALGRVPRHEFVPPEFRSYAYLNRPLPIGCDKTISQPFIVALMTDSLQLRPDDTVLEIGTGLGYQAAILAELCGQVYSVEIIQELGQKAAENLVRYDNVELKIGNGYYGWPEHAPFDKIIVTAAPDLIPPPLISQLKPGGRMAIPAGLPDSQQLMLVEKSPDGTLTTKEILPVRFSELEGAEAH